jgi:polygalacturonase
LLPFCIRDFGAVADGKTDSTAAIQKAIDACAGKGGGTVLVEGGPFMTYTLYLKSHVRLEVAGGAALEGGPDPALYPEFDENTYSLSGARMCCWTGSPS